MSEAGSNPNMETKCPQCGAPLPSGVLAGLCPACLFKQGAAAETAVEPEIAPFQPPSLEEVARMFPQLEILALLGKGGMGVVYKARQPALDRLVALKILPPQTAIGSGFIERFNREARALAKLTHPNIVAVHEFGQVNGLPFFIMEFVDGLNLRELERAGQLSPQQALRIVPQICEALQFAHDEGIVHRDIKPENILLDKRGRVKIADFGIAKILGAESGVAITETKGAIGTPHYMAPEQVEKPGTVDHRADIFSLGVVFYEMLTGELPLGKFAPPSSRKIEIDMRLDEVVLHALEKDPERRYQHVSQVKTAVDTIASTAVPVPTNAEAMAREILARDYVLNIRSCFRRAWALIRRDFWPLVGGTALVLALLGVAGSAGGVVIRRGAFNELSSGTSIIALLVFGPLMGGLSLYYLKKIRGEPATIETAFSGFTTRFLHLFLAGFVTWALTALGFLCLVLPGIYLMVAWWFTLVLVIDKHLDFWAAMELSRKVVTRHWFKFFGFFLLFLLVCAMGAAVLLVGLFIAAPIAMIAAMYAYEDIFGMGAEKTIPTAVPAGFGPMGTERIPASPPTPGPGQDTWAGVEPRIGIAALILAMGAIMLFFTVERHRSAERYESENAARRSQSDSNSNFDAFLNRVREELSNISARFNGLRVSEQGENGLLVTFSELEEKVMLNGTNVWQSIDGSLAAERIDDNKWQFQGQGELRTVRFDMADIDRTKLVETSSAANLSGNSPQSSHEVLADRLEAASAMNNPGAKDNSLAKVAADAAKAGEVDIAKDSLERMTALAHRWQATRETALLLAKRGMRQQALEIAKDIGSPNVRDEVLSELAQ
jgi:predicted Ser/Thr protein kinase